MHINSDLKNILNQSTINLKTAKSESVKMSNHHHHQQNSALQQQQTQFFATANQQQQQAIFYQAQAQAADRFQQMTIHQTHPVNMPTQPINAHGFGNGQHPQLHNYQQGPTPHQHTQSLLSMAAGPNNQPMFAPHPSHQQPPMAPLFAANFKAPPPSMALPGHQQVQPFYPAQPQHQSNVPPPQSAPPFGQNQQLNYNPYVETPPPLPPHQQQHHHQQTTHFYAQPQLPHQQNLPPQSAPPFPGQAQFYLQYPPIPMEQPPPPPQLVHHQPAQHVYPQPQQHHQQNLPAQSAPPHQNQPSSYIPPTPKDRRSYSIQPADGPLHSIGNTGGSIEGGNVGNGGGINNANEGTDNNGNGRDGQTPADGRESSTADGQRKTTPLSVEANKEEDMKRSASGNGDIINNQPMNRMGEWQAQKDKPVAAICPNNIGGSGVGDGHSTTPSSDLATNSTAINAPPPPSTNYQNQQPNSQPQSRRQSQDVRYNYNASFQQQQSGRGEYQQQNWKQHPQNRPSFNNNNYKSNMGGIGGGSNGPTTNTNMYTNHNPPSNAHPPHQFHHYNQQQQSFGRQSQDVRSQQCMSCGAADHRLHNCQKSKDLAMFAQIFERQTRHPALQLHKETMPQSNRPHHYQQQGGGRNNDFYHHNAQSQQYNQHHKRVGSGGGGGGGGQRYNNYGGRDSGGGGPRGPKREGNNNYRPQQQQPQ